MQLLIRLCICTPRVLCEVMKTMVSYVGEILQLTTRHDHNWFVVGLVKRETASHILWELSCTS